MPNNINPAISSHVPQGHAVTQYSNVPSSARTATQATANAKYVDPFNGSVTYYDVPSASASPIQGHAASSYSSSGTPQTAQSSTSQSSSSSGLSITQSPAATGENQLPGWVQNALLSGKTSEWTNSKTGQTFYAPHALGTNAGIWLSGPNYSGPVSGSGQGAYINEGGSITPVATAPTTTIKNNGVVLYKGASTTAPHIEYSADGKFTGLLNVLQTSTPAAEFTDYQTFNTANGKVSLPTTLQDGPIAETGTWKQNAEGGFSFMPLIYTFADGSTSATLKNPTIQLLESYGISAAQAEQMLKGLSGSLDISILANGKTGYSVKAVPTPGSTQVINVPMQTINGKTTGGVDLQTGAESSPFELPIIYSYDTNGIANPIGFQGADGALTKTLVDTINGQSYTFAITSGNIEYAPTGSQAFEQVKFNGNSIQLAGAAAASGAQQYAQNNAPAQPTSPSVSGFTLSQPQDVGALSSQTISPGSTPTTLSTLGGAGQYTLPLGGLSFSQSGGAPITSIANTQSVPNTNTSPNAPFNPLSLASWETYGNEVPGYIASTAANLAKSLGSIPGYTPGGAPTAGGQFPYNYPYGQTSIK